VRALDHDDPVRHLQDAPAELLLPQQLTLWRPHAHAHEQARTDEVLQAFGAAQQAA
jgi:hypothetical protein